MRYRDERRGAHLVEFQIALSHFPSDLGTNFDPPYLDPIHSEHLGFGFHDVR